jgi:hypothetical protein
MTAFFTAKILVEEKGKMYPVSKSKSMDFDISSGDIISFGKDCSDP